MKDTAILILGSVSIAAAFSFAFILAVESMKRAIGWAEKHLARRAFKKIRASNLTQAQVDSIIESAAVEGLPRLVEVDKYGYALVRYTHCQVLVNKNGGFIYIAD